MFDFINSPFAIFQVLVFVIVVISGLVVGGMLFKEVDIRRDKMQKSFNIILGKASAEERGGRKKEKEQEKSRKKEKQKKGFKAFYQQYTFFYKPKNTETIMRQEERAQLAKVKIWKQTVIGLIGFFVIYFLITNSLLLSSMLTPLYLVLWYFVNESKMKKKRIEYIRSFIMALDIISASVQAGNSFEEGVKVVAKRDSIMPEMKQQFVLLDNHIKSSIPLNEALEMFSARNKMFEEFNMFVIIMQFYIKTGGKNLDKIFMTMNKALTQKVENYSIIESKLVTYQYAFNFFVFGYILVTLLAPFFIEGFYDNILTDPNGTVAVGGSIFALLGAVYLFKSSVKSAAEG